MTSSALLKKVRAAYPEAFEALTKPKLKLVESAIIYASKLTGADEVLSDLEHKKILVEFTGKDKLGTGDRLKAYRLREDFTQIELAKKSGISQANISAMEAGRRSIGVQTAKKLAQALGCDFRQLI